jgi:hypothetical protein
MGLHANPVYEYLPAFLDPLKPSVGFNLPYLNAVFRHRPPLGPVHALWWPCRDVGKYHNPEVVLLFIPGNLLPGYLSYGPDME